MGSDLQWVAILVTVFTLTAYAVLTMIRRRASFLVAWGLDVSLGIGLVWLFDSSGHGLDIFGFILVVGLLPIVSTVIAMFVRRIVNKHCHGRKSETA